MSAPVPAPCADCGVDTTPCTGRPGCRHAGRWEWYVVRDEVWRAAAGPVRGFLCVGCLERRLGRHLRAADFANVRVNRRHPWDTERLAARKVAVA